MSVIEIIKALEGPAGLVIGAFGKGWFDRQVNKASARRTDAETDEIVARAAAALVDPLTKRVNQLSERVEKLETENATTKSRLRDAVDYIRTLLLWISVHIQDKTPPPPPGGLEI